MSYRIMLNASKNYDLETLNKMENEGIGWFIKQYAASAFTDKKLLLERYTGEVLNRDKKLAEQAPLNITTG